MSVKGAQRAGKHHGAGVALVATLLMTIVPARQAGRVMLAEALRYE